MGPVPIDTRCRLVNSLVLHCDVTTNQTIYLVQQSFMRVNSRKGGTRRGAAEKAG